MKDPFGRQINYLRISVTDRCDLRCRYCMPEQGIAVKSHDEILSYEEILTFVEMSTNFGINKVRLTGGEPLVRKGIVDFVARINQIPGIKEIGLTTNARKLAPNAKALKEAGLKSINISLDTLDPEKYRYITRWGDLNDVLHGIDQALKVGFDKVKINAVLMKGFNDHEILDLVNLAKDKPVDVRFIELMGIGQANELASEYLSTTEIMTHIPGLRKASDDNLINAGPADYYTLEGYQGRIGFISALSNCFCGTCNRLRLTSDGKLMPCLHSKIEVNVRPYLKEKDLDGLRDAIHGAIELKPSGHKLSNGKQVSDDGRYMSQIGG